MNSYILKNGNSASTAEKVLEDLNPHVGNLSRKLLGQLRIVGFLFISSNEFDVEKFKMFVLFVQKLKDRNQDRKTLRIVYFLLSQFCTSLVTNNFNAERMDEKKKCLLDLLDVLDQNELCHHHLPRQLIAIRLYSKVSKLLNLEDRLYQVIQPRLAKCFPKVRSKEKKGSLIMTGGYFSALGHCGTLQQLFEQRDVLMEGLNSENAILSRHSSRCILQLAQNNLPLVISLFQKHFKHLNTQLTNLTKEIKILPSHDTLATYYYAETCILIATGDVEAASYCSRILQNKDPSSIKDSDYCAFLQKALHCPHLQLSILFTKVEDILNHFSRLLSIFNRATTSPASSHASSRILADFCQFCRKNITFFDNICNHDEQDFFINMSTNLLQICESKTNEYIRFESLRALLWLNLQDCSTEKFTWIEEVFAYVISPHLIVEIAKSALEKAIFTRDEFLLVRILQLLCKAFQRSPDESYCTIFIDVSEVGIHCSETCRQNVLLALMHQLDFQKISNNTTKTADAAPKLQPNNNETLQLQLQQYQAANTQMHWAILQFLGNQCIPVLLKHRQDDTIKNIILRLSDYLWTGDWTTRLLSMRSLQTIQHHQYDGTVREIVDGILKQHHVSRNEHTLLSDSFPNCT